SLREQFGPMVAPPEERSEPGLIREMRAVGVDPSSQEGRALWMDLKMREGATEQELERLRLSMLEHQYETARREQASQERAAEQQRQQATFEINKTLEHLEEA